MITKKENGGDVEVAYTPNIGGGASLRTTEDGGRYIGIVSEEELRRVAEIPPDWATVEVKANTWPQQDSDGPFLACQIKGRFRPPAVTSTCILDAISELKEASPEVGALPRYDVPVDSKPVMLEVSITDLHLGLITHGAEDGTAGKWDLERAEQAYLRALVSLLRAAAGYTIEEIVFPVGNDFLHVDNAHRTTTGGTPMPDAAPYTVTFKRGVSLLRRAIELLADVAPVKVLVIPGNHDEMSMLHLGMILEAYFHANARVEVDATPDTYKRVVYGANLIGFEHGYQAGAKRTRLAALMAQKWPKDWAETKFRAWHLGDQHRHGGFSEMGVEIAHLPSLAPANRWHVKNMFNFMERCAVAFVWSRTEGEIARLQSRLLRE